MESDALNFFLPFRRLEPNHENRLTRALLVVLRYSPMAHSAWLRLVAPDRHLQRVPVADFRTQTRAVRHAGGDDEPAGPRRSGPGALGERWSGRPSLVNAWRTADAKASAGTTHQRGALAVRISS